jgi:hypothetical protein
MGVHALSIQFRIRSRSTLLAAGAKNQSRKVDVVGT